MPFVSSKGKIAFISSYDCPKMLEFQGPLLTGDAVFVPGAAKWRRSARMLGENGGCMTDSLIHYRLRRLIVVTLPLHRKGAANDES